jgi:YHS domain-containing protein
MKELATSPVVHERGCLARRVVLRAEMVNDKPVKFIVHWQNVENKDDYYGGLYFACSGDVMNAFQRAWKAFIERSNKLVDTDFQSMFGDPSL